MIFLTQLTAKATCDALVNFLSTEKIVTALPSFFEIPSKIFHGCKLELRSVEVISSFGVKFNPELALPMFGAEYKVACCTLHAAEPTSLTPRDKFRNGDQ